MALTLGLWAGLAAAQAITGSSGNRFAVQVTAAGMLQLGTFDVGGSSLTGDITVTPSGSVEIRNVTDGGSFTTSPVVLTQTGGAVATKTFEFRPTSYTYTLGQTSVGTATLTSAGASTVNLTFLVLGNPAVTTVLAPRFIQGTTTSGSNRVSSFWRLRIQGLAANTQYRYATVLVLGTNSADNSGAGNPIFADNTSLRYPNAGASLSAANNHDTLTTDAMGNYEGWFGVHPTNNATRFVPGAVLFPRVLVADLANTPSSTVFPTGTISSTVINWNETTVPSSISAQTIYGRSNAPGRDFVCLYDNVSGTGQPLAITTIENDGFSPNSSAPFYAMLVNTQAGRWGTVIPSQLANGVRRIERRLFADGTVSNVSTDADGSWPSGANTVNPTGGQAAAAIEITATDAPLDATSSLEEDGRGELGRALRLGPNPATDEIRLMGTVVRGGRLELELTGLGGAVVTRLQTEVQSEVNQTIRIADLAPGFYVLRGSLAGQVGTWKVIKQ